MVFEDPGSVECGTYFCKRGVADILAGQAQVDRRRPDGCGMVCTHRTAQGGGTGRKLATLFLGVAVATCDTAHTGF